MRRVLIGIGMLLGSICSYSQDTSVKIAKATMDLDGTVHLPPIIVPPSSLSSDEAKRHFEDFVSGFASLFSDSPTENDSAVYERLDDLLVHPGIAKLRRAFAVEIKRERFGDVLADSIEPADGVADKNRRRILINLRGGGLGGTSLLSGQMEAIPIASLGSFRVITVGYRGAPQSRFPAASEDVATVYTALLHRYPHENIGIYGCSDGGLLTAESVAWFHEHRIPLPGAVGIFGQGALMDLWGDSNYVGSGLMGWDIPLFHEQHIKQEYSYFSVANLDPKDPLVSPVYSPIILSRFPPSLLISGTRDIGLSAVVYTHAQLVKAGATSDLHVWEGAPHCSFAQPVVDPAEPESREAWKVIVKFFDAHLGK